MAMKRTTVDGKTLNQRTADMLAMWQFNALRDFYVVQGSYNRGVSASAGTHDGGGALDLSTYGWGDLKDKKWIVKQGRLCGFAAWLRPTRPGLWNEHVHGIAIGDGEADPSAKAQVAEYYRGGDGLVGSASDPDPRVKPIPVWPNRPLKKVSGLVAYRQFKAKKPAPRMTVKRIQWVLNEKLDGPNLVVDGVAGPATREAYKRWERKIGAPATDGVPGKFGLNKLGAGRFKVGWLSYEKWRETQREDRETVKRRAAENEEKNPTFPKK